MKTQLLGPAIVSLCLLTFATSIMAQSPAIPAQDSPTISITRSGSQAPQVGPADYFTGSVHIDPLFPARDPSRVSGASVTFQPGARSAWHTHPLGQTLIVTAGSGLIQREGGPIEEIHQGDVVWIPPGQKHWHGASPTNSLTHIAIQEAVDGKAVDWLEKVTEEQYHMKTNAELKTGPAGTAAITQSDVQTRRLSPEDVRKVAPALEKYKQERLFGQVWKRPGLSPRDRSIVTLSALITRGMAPALSYYANQAIENGVKPREISEIITHLAFYSGWANAFAAVGPVKDVFAQRGISSNELPSETESLLPLNEAAEAQRAAQVGEQFGSVAPGVVQDTTDVLFRDLWLRPGLAPRDRSLVTVSALITSGQVAQIPYHLNRAMDNGLTQEEAGEVIAHLAYYAGWPNAFSALPVAKEVFQKRAK
ncbi:MAG: carboxymuconolactone decarboxylase family protein [Chthoniobacteraceae bacterium]|nr:carboxymuconolactone decarboxylase family protein [Chthoniobacteraceae bacterium]